MDLGPSNSWQALVAFPLKKKTYWPLKVALEKTMVTVAESDLVESACETAVIVTMPVSGGDRGAV